MDPKTVRKYMAKEMLRRAVVTLIAAREHK